MQKHLALISLATPCNKYAVIIMDQASWHQSYLADEFKNLTIIYIPPYSPELNPIEQVWSWLQQHEIANRCFDSYEDIVDKLCNAWNRFCSVKIRIESFHFVLGTG
ncbi:TPA: transposase [Vibrio cholerae]|nr:transposase [Vibrio cholerae]